MSVSRCFRLLLAMHSRPLGQYVQHSPRSDQPARRSPLLRCEAELESLHALVERVDLAGSIRTKSIELGDINRTNLLSGVAFLTLSLSLGMPAMAQTSEPGSVNSEEGGQPNAATTDEAADDPEIVVTALKRGVQDLTETPAGISVIDGAAIEASGARGLEDFLQQSPSTTITASGIPGVNSIQIRGVSATFGAASVGFYLDDLPFTFINTNYLPDPSVFDLQSVEVLRGPQGSLYGAGASGGVVLVRTNNPDLNDFEGKAEGRVSTTDDGGENFFLGGAINVPIVNDRVALRITGDYYDDSGWIERPALNQVNFNDSKRLSLRGKLRIAATDRLMVQLQGAISRIDTGGSVIADPQGNLGGLVDQTNAADYDQLGAIATYDFGGAVLTSTTSYLDFSSVGENVAIVSIPTGLFAENFAQEVRLNSSGERTFSWLIGGFYNDISTSIRQELSGIGAPFDFAENFDAKRFSVFGEGTLALFDRRLELTAGASYFEDETKGFTEFLGFPLTNAISTSIFSPKLSAAFHPNSDSTLYAVVSKGFRPATLDFTFSTFFAQQAVPGITGRVGTEELTAYEVGYKTDAFDRRLHFETALFYNDIKNTQQSAAVIIPGTLTPVTTVLNVGDAESYGVELVVSARPTRSLTLNFSGSYTKSRIKQDFFAPGADPASATPLFMEGQPLTLVPKWLLNGSINHRHDLGSLRGAVTMSAQYTSKRPLSALSQAPVFGDDNIRVDARYELGRDEWTAFVFAENLFNDDNAITPSQVSSFFPPGTGLIATRFRPRTLGIGARFNF